MEQNGMKINTKKGKTEVMRISRDQGHQLDIFMGDDRLNQSEEYKYLGVMIGQRNLQEMEINARIAKYSSNTALLYPLLKDESIPRKSKLIIYQSILKPILLYGAEDWSLTSKTESSLQAAEMRVLRTIVGVTRRDRIRNATIREKLRDIPLLEEVERMKLRWYGHIMRMDEERKQKMYLQWKPDAKRPVGRPRKRWMEGIKIAIEKRKIFD